MRSISFGIFAVLALIFLYFSQAVVIVSLIGIGIGVLLAPVLSYARRKFKIPRALSALFILSFVVLVLGGAGYAAWFLVADQAENFSQKIPEITANLKIKMAWLFKKYPWLLNQVESLSVGDSATGLAGQILIGVQLSFEAVSGLIFALILSLYVAVSVQDYFLALIRAFPQRHRQKAADVLSKCATTLRLWFRAQVIDMVILGFITAIGLWIAGVDYWALYGLLTAIFGIIPYIGTLFVVVCAALITWAAQPELLGWVIFIFVVVQQIEGNIILPMLMKGNVELPEVPLLIFILLMGSWLGIVGVFLAPPIFAVLRILYLELYLPKVNLS